MDYVPYLFSKMEEYSVFNPIVLLLLIYFLVVKVLKLLSTPEPPRLTYYKDYLAEEPATSSESVPIEKNRIEELIDRCPMLKEP